MLGFDNEQGAEIYSAATKEEQARIVHSEAQRMCKTSGNLGGIAEVYKKTISIDSTNSFWRPLGRDSKSEDGLNIHVAIIDELHAHPDSGMWDIIRSALGARAQPLMFAITTAGFNKHSFCYEQREYAIKILEGVIEDDSFFAIIYTLDEDDEDNWKDESVWIKANPNLGVCVDIKDMQNMCAEAIESPTKLNNFLVKKLNIWTTQHVRWMNMEKWEACNEVVPEQSLLGKKCYASIDLSTNTDIASLGLLFPYERKYVFIPRFWIPEDRARERQKKDRVPYVKWAKEGYIKMTHGDVIDYDTIMSDIWSDFGKFDIQFIAFDRWNFEAIRQRLVKEGVPETKLISFGQGFASMSAPMKKVEEIVLSNRLIHNNNPVLNWMAGNVAAKTDPADNIKPDKEESTERIDGIVTLIMSLGVAITQMSEIDLIENAIEVGF